MKRYLLIASAVMVVAFGVGAGIALLGNPEALDKSGIGSPSRPLDRLPAFSYEDLHGNERSSTEWPGHLLVVNFWATWCPPCRAEIPGFIALQEKYRNQQVQFVGIAVDEKSLVAEFAESLGVNYPLLLGDMDAVELSRKIGNRFGGLPFTVIVDREGTIRHRQPGEITRAELEPLLEELL